jgi:hypothetical protein
MPAIVETIACLIGRAWDRAYAIGLVRLPLLSFLRDRRDDRYFA